MNILWDYIDSREFSDEGKICTFLFTTCTLSGIAGLIVWLFIRLFALNTIEYALCFIVYPAFLVGILGGFIFLCKQDERNR